MWRWCGSWDVLKEKEYKLIKAHLTTIYIYTYKLTFFKLNRFPTTTHAGAGYSLSLYWDCTVLFMHGHNNNNLLLLLTRERDPQGIEWPSVHTTNSNTRFFLSTTGASLCTGREPHLHTDDKFQKRSRNNVASKLLELHIAMGHWWLALRRTETTVVCHLLMYLINKENSLQNFYLL